MGVTPAKFERVELGPCVLYCGDCLEVLPTLSGIDVVVTDPPYDDRTHSGAVLGEHGIEFSALENPGKLAAELVAIARRWVVAFCAFEQLGAYRDGVPDAWVRSGIWDKVRNMPQLTGDRPAQGGEAIAILHRTGKKKWNGGGKAAIWRHSVEAGEKVHPTQKPARLIGELVQLFSDRDETVLDPFMGSGTTGVACIRTGRRFIGVEKDPKYFAIALERIERELRQGRLF